ncbi:hypothetical protein [Leptolyngbya sp. FACHB-16]|uniref:hypothetical protein n=1 Tax=unclassified Leptolyngbya TaxID=2650499 RepID=UPI001995F033|nr:hypothetical protein [Leptolyngbya sp. FACHB-16]MBD2154925.1 hypothetical protein [Leptolyngbya sp. FACHB-16]
MSLSEGAHFETQVLLQRWSDRYEQNHAEMDDVVQYYLSLGQNWCLFHSNF